MYNQKETEKKIKEFWKKIKLLDKLQNKNKNGKNYFLLDGPPYANFIPHVGHIRNTVYKDLNIRIAFSKGFNVFFQPGFDTHGLPVENMIEKKLNMKSKKDIENFGIDKFTKACKEGAALNKDLWMQVYDMLGSWYPWKEPYLTYENYYLESAWWTFKKLWSKNLVYEGKKPVYWCPKCETALAGYEVTDSYINRVDPSIIVKFKVKSKNEYLLVFTTTPWTLISNVAIAAHPNEDYVKVETIKGNFILAKNRLTVLEDLGIGYKILEEFKGKKLDGLSYEPLLDVPVQKELQNNKKALKVYMSIPILKERIASKVATKKDVGESRDIFEEFVTVEEGTGLVHTAPGHGKTDNEVGKHYSLPDVSPLDDRCKYTEEAGLYKDMFVKDADLLIIEKLEKENKLIYQTKEEHRYPVCWRCKSPLIFRMSNQWFLKTQQIKQKILKLNKKVKWFPDYAKERFESWVSNAEDWNISRQRYWGIPIPLWRCNSCNEIRIIGSFDELKKNSISNINNNFDLHNANQIKLKCKCKKNMERIRDIFDVWFDSGIAPWASLGYPFMNKKLFEDNFPVSRINESQDQIRGWFYSLIFCAVATFDKNAYNEVSMPGWVVDDKGEKMSKSLNNVIYAKDALEEFGADLLRFYYMFDIASYELQKFSKETIKKEINKFFNTLWNLHIYTLNKYKNNRFTIKKIEDKWIISELNSLIKQYNKDLDKFDYHLASRNLYEFIINKLSREYIQMTREREDEELSYVLKECLLKSLVILSPISPFVTDEIYQNLKSKFKLKEESIHLEKWPKYNPKLINKKLEQNMEVAKLIIQNILAEREKVKINVRWPLSEAVITTEKNIKQVLPLIQKQTNIKKITLKKGKEDIKLDTTLTKELEREGFTREVIRRIQDLRKKANLNKENKIELNIVSKVDLDYNTIKKTTNANIKEIKGKFSDKFKIKDKDFEISFNVIK